MVFEGEGQFQILAVQCVAGPRYKNETPDLVSGGFVFKLAWKGLNKLSPDCLLSGRNPVPIDLHRNGILPPTTSQTTTSIIFHFYFANYLLKTISSIRTVLGAHFKSTIFLTCVNVLLGFARLVVTSWYKLMPDGKLVMFLLRRNGRQRRFVLP